jgi:hypothetical protein
MTKEYKVYEDTTEISTHATMEEAYTELTALKEQYPEKNYGIAISANDPENT